jgi:hypothetical protein
MSEENEDEPTYKISRFYQDLRPRETIETGLTRKEAQAHCSDPDSSGVTDDGVRWFDGFEEE